jgi:tRNA-Thr(GGU) m(6)t(6)A37 methyltransferase TsaA
LNPISMTPIGTVHSTRRNLQDDKWLRETTSIELDPTQFSDDALAGLSEFSHVEIVFFMDKADPAKVETHARRPRENSAWPRVGIFSQRGKDRPNHIGTTVCKIKGVSGRILQVEGLDAVDGTPVLDIKPWVAEFGPRDATFQPSWMSEMMDEYW